jgi:hypothetical protein
VQNDVGFDRIFALRISEFEQPYRDAVLPCEQRLPKSLPQLSIRHTAAQTRIVSTAETQGAARHVVGICAAQSPVT